MHAGGQRKRRLAGARGLQRPTLFSAQISETNKVTRKDEADARRLDEDSQRDGPPQTVPSRREEAEKMLVFPQRRVAQVAVEREKLSGR